MRSGSILQTRLFLSSSEHTTSAIVSLIVSALSIAYTSATLSYDFDTSVYKRRDSPKMYGYIPEEGRFSVFSLIFFLSLLQVVMKVIATALLALTNVNWFLIWFASDAASFVFYKIARRDFVYFVPLEKKWVKYLFSFL